MPKVISYTPPWLAQGSAGYQLFTEATANGAGTTNSSKAGSKNQTRYGPRKTIARRGKTEVFIAVGREIRWADLAYLKGAYEHKEATKYSAKGKRRDSDGSQYDAETAQGYRILKTPVADDIKQLVISPGENYMAILTTHTVHIAILPDPSQLTATDTGPLKLRYSTLGPTTHVTSQAAISSALWHPLGVNGTCIVTVTLDAIVRVWELSLSNYSTCDRPTLAIDLKKLADGTSSEQDFSVSVNGANKGFSPDSFEMEVASACFAGRRSGGWSPMTLWVAMREGDVYALCPLLPEKWSPPPTLIPSLSVSIVAKVAVLEDDPEVSQQTKLLAQQQLAWMSEIDSQEPSHAEPLPGGAGDDEPMEVFNRPTKPGRIPRLQGPFDFEYAPEDSDEESHNLLSDILVIGGKLDAEELMFGEEDELDLGEADQEGLSVDVICVLTSGGRLSICLDLEGVEAQWLPKTKSKASRLLEEFEAPSLLTFEVMSVSRPEEVWEGSWPVFTPDFYSRYKFFVTDTSSVTFVDLASWVSRLESELSEDLVNSAFRIEMLAKGERSERKRLYSRKPFDRTSPLSASIIICDPDLGYFLLTTTPYGPLGLTFEEPEVFDLRRSQSRSPAFDATADQPIILVQPRPPFEPAHTLDIPTGLPQFLNKLEHSRFKRIMNEEVRLSPATLQIMTEVHKVVSAETFRLGDAAAEVFRRCLNLQQDLKSHITKAREVAARVDAVTEVESEDGSLEEREVVIERTLMEAKRRQKELNDRIDAVKNKVSRHSGRPLSDKEKHWVREFNTMKEKIIPEDETDSKDAREPWARYEDAKSLVDDLMVQVRKIEADGSVKSEIEEKTEDSWRVPRDLKQAKTRQIQSLLERQTALVDATKNRLENLRLVD